MNKGRLEAFSDGVFAIAITLLVLSIRIPGAEVASDKALQGALRDAWPNLLTFVFSFLVVGIFWVAHVRIFSYIAGVNHFILWANIFYLLTVALIPFPAAVLATHPFFPTAIIFYCGVLFLCAAQHFLLLSYVERHDEIREKKYTTQVHRQSMMMAVVGPACYLLGAVLSLVSPIASFCCILAAILFYVVVLFFLLPGRVTRK